MVSINFSLATSGFFTSIVKRLSRRSNNFPNNAKARRKLEPRTSISVAENDSTKGSGAVILQELAKQKLLQKDLARQEKNKKQSKKRKAKKIRVIQAVVESKHEEAEKLREKQETLPG